MITRKFLECDVVDVCNLSCKSCGHVAPYYRKNWYSFTQFKQDLEALSKVFVCENFVFLGGEPMLLRDKIPEYVKAVRDSGISKRVKIVTNGILAPQYTEYLKLFDWVHISLYDHSHKESIKEWFRQNEKEFARLGIELYLAEPPRGFAYAYSTERLTDERAELSWVKCGAKTWCHQLYNGYYYLCGPIAKFHRVLEEKGISIEQRGCNLYGSDLEQRLLVYLDTKEKLPTCNHCLGHLDFHTWQEEKVK